MIQVKGIIIPVAWDVHGNVAEVGIETFDEDFYLIDATSEVDATKVFLREPVEVFGFVTTTPDTKSIHVHRIGPLNKNEKNRSLGDARLG